MVNVKENSSFILLDKLDTVLEHYAL